MTLIVDPTPFEVEASWFDGRRARMKTAGGRTKIVSQRPSLLPGKQQAWADIFRLRGSGIGPQEAESPRRLGASREAAVRGRLPQARFAASFNPSRLNTAA